MRKHSYMLRIISVGRMGLSCKKWTGRKLDQGSNYGNQKWTGLGLGVRAKATARAQTMPIRLPMQAFV